MCTRKNLLAMHRDRIAILPAQVPAILNEKTETVEAHGRPRVDPKEADDREETKRDRISEYANDYAEARSVWPPG